LKGIDISSYQGEIDFSAAVADGVQFVIMKIIKKSLKPDSRFEENWASATKASCPVRGVYNYSYATSTSKAISDAKTVLEVLSGRKPMVWLDVEDSCQKALKIELINIIRAYGETIRYAGIEFGVYTGLSFYKDYILPYAADLDFPFWIARYPSDSRMLMDDNPDDKYKPAISHRLYGWQYTSKGAVGGIVGNVDLNILYDEIEVPDPSYTVRPGDTLSRIARTYNTTVSRLVQVNALKDPDKIYPGQIIRF
jgi:GH25 family lysozyme M1 (1,4-beta-N-acetylmuramidase)